MGDQSDIEIKHLEVAIYTRKCPFCGKRFKTDNPRKRYCTKTCKKGEMNRRHYAKYREQIIEKVIARRKAKGE